MYTCYDPAKTLGLEHENNYDRLNAAIREYLTERGWRVLSVDVPFARVSRRGGAVGCFTFSVDFVGDSPEEGDDER